MADAHSRSQQSLVLPSWCLRASVWSASVAGPLYNWILCHPESLAIRPYRQQGLRQANQWSPHDVRACWNQWVWTLTPSPTEYEHIPRTSGWRPSLSYLLHENNQLDSLIHADRWIFCDHWASRSQTVILSVVFGTFLAKNGGWIPFRWQRPVILMTSVMAQFQVPW